MQSSIHLPRNYWPQTSGGLQRVEVEIGSGDGAFLIEAARSLPQTFFVGLEFRNARIERLQQRSGLPENLRFLHADGRWVVNEILATASIDAYHVYFPDPWWKKRHHKRRLFGPEFCTAALRTLKADGRLYAMTDVSGAFHDLRAEMRAAGFLEQEWDAASERDRSGSSYERKYRAQGRRFFQTSFLLRPPRSRRRTLLKVGR